MATRKHSSKTESLRGAGRTGARRAVRGEGPARVRANTSRNGASRAARSRAGTRNARRWSQHVTDTSDALSLESGVFRLSDPRKIAQSLRRSAEASNRRKSPPFRSAMSMLVFYINRAGANLPEKQRATLEQAKAELRKLYGRPA